MLITLWQCEDHLTEIITAVAPTLQELAPADGFRLMLDFYRDDRVEVCIVEEDGDMLLYQWGTYDWGEGEAFRLNLTRQLIEQVDEDEDSQIQQLALTFRFKPTLELSALGEGNRWCFSPDELDQFRSFIVNSPAYVSAIAQRPDQVTLGMSATD